MTITGFLKKRSRFSNIGMLNRYFLFRKKYLFKNKSKKYLFNTFYNYPITLYFIEAGVIKKSEIDSAKKLLMRKLKKKYLIHINSFYPVSKKSLGIRMGKGKSSKPSLYYAKIKEGQPLLSIIKITLKDDEKAILKSLKAVSAKFSLKLRVYRTNGW